MTPIYLDLRFKLKRYKYHCVYGLHPVLSDFLNYCSYHKKGFLKDFPPHLSAFSLPGQPVFPYKLFRTLNVYRHTCCLGSPDLPHPAALDRDGLLGARGQPKERFMFSVPRTIRSSNYMKYIVLQHAVRDTHLII